MIDFAWSEFLFIALLALILIGPKELPTVLRYIGRMVGKARAFTKEFSSQLDFETHMESTDLDTKNTDSPKDKEFPLPKDTKL
ncbi:MAG: Sec-independent protein translocase subunit TatA/TatB [Candidatus Paracaedibacter sp.]